jgi:hypothetical protein
MLAQLSSIDCYYDYYNYALVLCNQRNYRITKVEELFD